MSSPEQPVSRQDFEEFKAEVFSRFEQLTRGLEQLTRGYEQLSRGYEQLTRGYEQLSHGYEQLARGQEQLAQGLQQLGQRLERAETTLLTGFHRYARQQATRTTAIELRLGEIEQRMLDVEEQLGRRAS